MITLSLAIQQNSGSSYAALCKHLTASGINDWCDLTKSNLCALRDTMLATLAPSSVKTYLAVLKGIIGRYDEEVEIPCKSYRDVLKARNEAPVKTYLDANELNELERVPLKNDTERFCLYRFLVGAYTGMRYSDICASTLANIHNGQIVYTSIKTGVTASMPCKPIVVDLIQWLNDRPNMDVTLAGYNKIIRRLCKRAGINTQVIVHKGGKDKHGEKWQFVSSHTARISFATNLANADVPVLAVSKLCGHTNLAMTERYIVDKKVKLNEQAMEYFK